MKQQQQSLIQAIFNKVLATDRPQPITAAEETQTLYYKNNPDGSIRWAWPKGLMQPLCLQFYNTPSRRAQWIAKGIRMIFKLRLQGLFASGKVQVALPQNWQNILGISGNEWAIFTGTAGDNRTALLYGNGQFYKIPIGANAHHLLLQEHHSISKAQALAFDTFEIPNSCLCNQILITNDVAQGAQQTGELGTLHWRCITELCNVNKNSMELYRLPKWAEAGQQLASLQMRNDSRIPKGMITKLLLLKNALDEEDMITTGTGHGDFTPWNIYVKDTKLAVIDWEMANLQTPALFDAFHFLYQHAALVGHSNFARLQKSINAALAHPLAEQWIERHQINIQLHHRIYLLFTIAYYLELYDRQAQWHPQVAWSIQLWNEALNAELLSMQLATPRQLLVMDMFGFLQTKSYALLKWPGGSPLALSEESDIDMCSTKEVSKQLLHYIKKHPLVKKVQQSPRTFMRNIGAVLQDGSLLSIDTIWKIKRKDLVMMDAQQLLKTVSADAFGIKTPLPQDDFTYTWLFYLLNGKSIPAKYRAQFGLGNKTIHPYMENHVAWLEKIGDGSFANLFYYNSLHRYKVIKELKTWPANKGWQQCKNKLGYLLDSLLEHRPRGGYIITFSGVDGAGKSTVIENIRHQVEKRYRRKVVVLRHRPALLPMLSAWKEGREAAEQKAAQRLPRQGNNKSTLSSLLRFGYYYTDYLIGQFMVQVKYVWRGYVVLYDRYYFDFINDGKRSNVSLSPKLTGMGYRLLLKPRFNFFLYADVDTILQRKQELDGPSIQQLTGNYLGLFRKLSRRYNRSQYIAIENISLPQTLHIIHQHLQPTIV